jgi:hypothetical protein
MRADVFRLAPESRHRPGAAAMTDPDPNPFADCDVIVCRGGAKLTAKHLASTIHCSDDEIIGWLERRRRTLAANRKGTFNADPLGIDLRLFGL